MPRDGSKTRTSIMDAAEELILQTGFTSASVDRVIERAEVTKGTFFYHFATKAALARALVDRYAELDMAHLHGKMDRAEKLARDPLQQLLIFVGLFEEEFGNLTEPYPGCLFASYVMEAGLFEDATIDAVVETFRAWRLRVGDKLREIADRHPPRLEVDLDSLADMISVVFEGAFLLSKTYDDPGTVGQQLRHYRNYLELLFGDPIAAGAT